MLIHDYLIVGSGPVGFHVFNQIKEKVILITGKTQKKIISKKIHPKIRLELERNTNKFADLIYSKKNNFYIYSSSEIGGFTNYWGRQFFDYKINEFWPKEFFKTYDQYKKNISKINELYPSIQSKIIKTINLGNLKINQLSPPLLKSPIVKKSKLKNKKDKFIIEDRVKSFKKIKKSLVEVKTEKKIFYCKKLILCAGPVGNSFILLRSFKNINSLKFRDDNPRMIFGIKTNKKNYLIKENDKMLDFDIFKSGKLNTYSTIYNIDPNHFNAFFKPIVKFFRSFLTKFFFYGQFWVKGEFNEIKINRDKNEIFLTGKNKNSNSQRINLINSLDKIGLKVFKILKLKFAYGFHYHSLRVNYKGKNETINNFLKNMKLNKEVLCFDSSIIKKISLKPPTKTFLATANYLVKKFKS